jgi:hypothetical protein
MYTFHALQPGFSMLQMLGGIFQDGTPSLSHIHNVTVAGLSQHVQQFGNVLRSGQLEMSVCLLMRESGVCNKTCFYRAADGHQGSLKS